MTQVDQSRPQLAVDLALFTMLTEDDLADSWVRELVTPAIRPDSELGLSLFVVTMQGKTGRKLPGSLVEGREQIADVGHRILRELLGIEVTIRLREIGTFDKVDRDPSSRVISIASWGFIRFLDLVKMLGGRDQVGLELVNSSQFIKQFADEQGGLEQFDGVSRFGFRYAPTPSRGHVKQLTADLGSLILEQDHDQIVFYAWRKLRYAFGGKLDPFRYLGVKALGEEFRLSDLQEFQDVACGIRTHRDQFRRQMLNASSFIVETKKTDSSRQGKPAALYKLGAPLEAGNE